MTASGVAVRGHAAQSETNKETDMFAALKNKLTGSVAKFNGNTDFLEAVCAASALVAYADGDVTDAEADAAVKAVVSNAVLSGAFSSQQIERTMDAMMKRAEGGRVGRSGLLKEIAEAHAKDTDGSLSETILLTALDVADQGGIDDKETAVLEKVASELKLDLKKYL